VPGKHLSEDALAVLLDHITVTRNDTLKVPFVDSGHTLVEGRSVRCTECIPDKSLLPDSCTSRSVDFAHQLCEYASGRVNISTRVLFCGWQVEQQIGLNQGLRRLVVEDELLVGVCVDVLGIELAIKGFVNVPAGVVLWAEQVCPGQWLFLTFTLLLQCIRADEFGVWEGLVPVIHEDMMLCIVGSNVLYGAHLVDLAANVIGESYRREDSYAAIL
jgi:hypothetical protein